MGVDEPEETDDDADNKPKGFSPKNKKIVMVAVTVAVIIILAIIISSLLGGDDNDNGNGPNHTPTADAGGDKTVTEGELIKFDASNSTDADQDKLTYRWEFDDGVKLAGKIVSRYFNVTGEFTVKLTVDDGKATDFDEAKILVQSSGPSGPPTITLNVEGKPPTTIPPTSGKYFITVTSSEPDEQIANFTFAIIKDENDAVILKDDVSDVNGAQGNVTFLDLGRQTLMDEGDTFTITVNEATLPIVDGDRFILYYKQSESEEVQVAEISFESFTLP